jgi:hypothetical protein
MGPDLGPAVRVIGRGSFEPTLKIIGALSRAFPSGSLGSPRNREERRGAPPWFAGVQKLGRHTAQAGLCSLIM